MRAARTILFFIVPLAAAVVLGLFSRLSATRRLDGGAYDRLLRLRAVSSAAVGILIVDVDAREGPLAGLLADGLVTLKEMDARSAVLDLPLAQKSPPALDPSALRMTLPNALDREFAQIEENIQSLFDAIRRGAVRPRDAARYVSDLVGLVSQAKQRLFGAALGIERDDDALLGQAAAFFGRVFVPLGLLAAADPSTASDLLDLAMQRQSIPVILTGRDPSVHAGGVLPAVLPVLRGVRGGGFLSDEADADGVCRRTPLLAEYDGQHVAQLALAAALDLLGNPAVEVSDGRVLLRNAVHPGGQPGALEIPLDESGEMLLNWPCASGAGTEEDGFRHLSWSALKAERRQEDSLVSDLRDMDSKGYLTYLRSSDSLLDVYEEGARLGRGMLAAGTDADTEQWRAAREKFFTLCDRFLGGDAETRVIADADRELQSGALSDEEKKTVQAERDRVSATFADARQVLAGLQQSRAELRQRVAGSFCIVSPDQEELRMSARGDGASRMAVTPFGSPATDARASAALVSTVLSGRFLREASQSATLILAAVLSLLLAAALFRLKPLPSFILGIAAAAVAAVAAGLVFAEYGLFVRPFVPCGSMFVTGLALASLKLAWERGASRTVRAAFAGRVSTQTLQSIDVSRSRLAPDGSLRQATVLFLGTRWAAGTPAEDPREVVRRLRTHRAALGEAILGLGGMVSDAGSGRVTASFGAPFECVDHARRACLASLRVQALERELRGTEVSAIKSTIGIHTGRCVAGFLGNRTRPDYSLIGFPADFAARLEGMNGNLGSSILISEQVREAAGPGFIVRMLGKTTHESRRAGSAMRVYELLAEKDGSDPVAPRLIAEFEEGVARFENRDTAGALAFFSRVLERSPGDGPAAAFALRCRQLLSHPGPDVTSFPW